MATVSDTPWSQFQESDYSPEQWRRACILHLADDAAKANHKLPVREPGGALNRNGCHAAAAALAGARQPLQAPANLKAAAAKTLVGLYRSQLQEDPPESLARLAGASVPTRSAGALTRATVGLRRASEGDGRTLLGRALPYGETTEIAHEGRPYLERMAQGCAARSLRERQHKLRALVQHNSRALPLGPVRSLEERADGLHVGIYVSRTRVGDEVLELVNDGAMDGLSVSFRPVAQEYIDGVVVRTEIALQEVSVTAFPAYENAKILGLRSDLSTVPLDVARRRLELALRSWL